MVSAIVRQWEAGDSCLSVFLSWSLGTRECKGIYNGDVLVKKRIRLSLQRLIGNLFGGVFSSYLNAPHGLELDELRQYQPGDDARSIDWKATAKTGKLHSRLKLVDKRVAIVFLIDRSLSEKFGTFVATKEEAQTSVTTLLVHAASEMGNEIGFVTFTDRIECYSKPGAGEKETLTRLRHVMRKTPSGKGTDLHCAFAFASENAPRPALVFIMSDFLAPYNYERALKTLSGLHEVVPVIISDRAETHVPDSRGLLTMQDMETGVIRPVAVSTVARKPAPYLALLRKLAIDHLAISTGEDEEVWIKKISEFFDRRIRRGVRRRR